MAQPSKPLPKPDPLTRRYWDALGEGRLELPVCDSCGHQIFYPRAHCPACHSRSVTWRQASGQAEVYALTIVYRPSSAFAAEAPFVVAMLQLEGGARLMANLDGVDIQDPLSVIGKRAELTLNDTGGDVTLPRFRLIGD